MGRATLVDQIVQSLAFEVEAVPVPQNDLAELSSTSSSSPMNVRIRVKKRNEHGVQHGIVTVPKVGYPDAIPERIRLISSDQTIMAFDVSTEANVTKKPKRKSRKNLFGGCLGLQYDDDESTYLPSTQYNAKMVEENVSSKSDCVIKQNFTLSKTKQTNLDLKSHNRKPDILGKCKPGGCLDPPFGEDKYVYKPRYNQEDKRTITSINEKHISTPTKIKLSKRVEVPSSLQESKTSKESLPQQKTNMIPEVDSITSLYDAKAKRSMDSKYSDSVITYPPNISSSKIDNVKSSKSRIASEEKHKKSFNNSEDGFYSSPRKNSRFSEKPSNAKDLSNAKYKYNEIMFEPKKKNPVNIVSPTNHNYLPSKRSSIHDPDLSKNEIKHSPQYGTENNVSQLTDVQRYTNDEISNFPSKMELNQVTTNAPYPDKPTLPILLNDTTEQYLERTGKQNILLNKELKTKGSKKALLKPHLNTSQIIEEIKHKDDEAFEINPIADDDNNNILEDLTGISIVVGEQQVGSPFISGKRNDSTEMDEQPKFKEQIGVSPSSPSKKSDSVKIKEQSSPQFKEQLDMSHSRASQKSESTKTKEQSSPQHSNQLDLSSPRASKKSECTKIEQRQSLKYKRPLDTSPSRASKKSDSVKMEDQLSSKHNVQLDISPSKLSKMSYSIKNEEQISPKHKRLLDVSPSRTSKTSNSLEMGEQLSPKYTRPLDVSPSGVSKNSNSIKIEQQLSPKYKLPLDTSPSRASKKSDSVKMEGQSSPEYTHPLDVSPSRASKKIDSANMKEQSSPQYKSLLDLSPSRASKKSDSIKMEQQPSLKYKSLLDTSPSRASKKSNIVQREEQLSHTHKNQLDKSPTRISMASEIIEQDEQLSPKFKRQIDMSPSRASKKSDSVKMEGQISPKYMHPLEVSPSRVSKKSIQIEEQLSPKYKRQVDMSPSTASKKSDSVKMGQQLSPKYTRPQDVSPSRVSKKSDSIKIEEQLSPKYKRQVDMSPSRASKKSDSVKIDGQKSPKYTRPLEVSPSGVSQKSDSIKIEEQLSPKCKRQVDMSPSRASKKSDSVKIEGQISPKYTRPLEVSPSTVRKKSIHIEEQLYPEYKRQVDMSPSRTSKRSDSVKMEEKLSPKYTHPFDVSASRVSKKSESIKMEEETKFKVQLYTSQSLESKRGDSVNMMDQSSSKYTRPVYLSPSRTSKKIDNLQIDEESPMFESHRDTSPSGLIKTSDSAKKEEQLSPKYKRQLDMSPSRSSKKSDSGEMEEQLSPKYTCPLDLSPSRVSKKSDSIKMEEQLSPKSEGQLDTSSSIGSKKSDTGDNMKEQSSTTYMRQVDMFPSRVSQKSDGIKIEEQLLRQHRRQIDMSPSKVSKKSENVRTEEQSSLKYNARQLNMSPLKVSNSSDSLQVEQHSLPIYKDKLNIPSSKVTNKSDIIKIEKYSTLEYKSQLGMSPSNISKKSDSLDDQLGEPTRKRDMSPSKESAKSDSVKMEEPTSTKYTSQLIISPSIMSKRSGSDHVERDNHGFKRLSEDMIETNNTLGKETKFSYDQESSIMDQKPTELQNLANIEILENLVTTDVSLIKKNESKPYYEKQSVSNSHHNLLERTDDKNMGDHYDSETKSVLEINVRKVAHDVAIFDDNDVAVIKENLNNIENTPNNVQNDYLTSIPEISEDTENGSIKSFDHTQIPTDKSDFGKKYFKPISDKIPTNQSNEIEDYLEKIELIETSKSTQSSLQLQQITQSKSAISKDKPPSARQSTSSLQSETVSIKSSKIRFQLTEFDIKPKTSTASKSSLKKEKVFLDLAFQSYVNDKKERTLKTLDTSKDLVRSFDDSITVVQSQLRPHVNEIKVPVDIENEIIIQLKKTGSPIQHVQLVDGGSIYKPSKSIPNMQKDYDSLMPDIYRSKYNKEEFWEKTVSRETARTLNLVYEHELVPLRNTIKSLKQEIDCILYQQSVLVEKLSKFVRAKPVRLLRVNSRCGCWRK